MNLKFLAAAAAVVAGAVLVAKRQKDAADAEADLWAEATDPLDGDDDPGESRG